MSPAFFHLAVSFAYNLFTVRFLASDIFVQLFTS